MVRTETKIETVCPIELDRTLAPKPQPPAAAVVKFNDAGGDYLRERDAWGDTAADLFNDARRTCLRLRKPPGPGG